MSRWFRHYYGMMRDPKFVGIAVRSKQPLERVLFVWGCQLESACENNADGLFDFDGDEIAYTLHCEREGIDAIVAALEEAGLVNGRQVVKWTSRQFQSDRDSTAAERQARRRAKLKNVTQESRVTVTSLTPESRSPDTDTDTDTDTPSLRSGAERGADAAAQASRVKKREPARSKIESDRQPDHADKVVADHAGMSIETMHHEWRQFRSHHIAKGSLMADWHAAWATWVGNWTKFGQRQIGDGLPPRVGPPREEKRNPKFATAQRAIERARERDRLERQQSSGVGLWPLGAPKRSSKFALAEKLIREAQDNDRQQQQQNDEAAAT